MRMNLLNIIIFSRHSFAVAQLRLTNWESESPASFNLHFQMLKPPPRWRPFETFPPRWQPSSACSSPSPPSSSSQSFLLTASDLIRVRIGRMKRNWYQSETLLRRRKPCCLVQPILLTTPWLLFSPLSLLCLPSCRSPLGCSYIPKMDFELMPARTACHTITLRQKKNFRRIS